MTEQPAAGEARRQWREAHGVLGTLPKDAYTPWIRRVAAWIVDYVLFLVVAATCGVIVGLIDSATAGSAPERIIQPLLYLLVGAFFIWNWGYRQGTTGSTIGKSLLRFKVVGERDGQPIGFGRSIVRYFAHFLDAIIFNVGYLLPLFTAKRQTIADMVMDTVCLPTG